MPQSIFSMVRDGQQYMRVWPMKKELYALFPECRVIAATRFSLKVMPPLAILSAAILVNQFGAAYLPQAIAIAAFFVSLPMQGLIWLGYRANQTLPPGTRSWYQQIYQKMQQQGCALQASKANPRYFELARLLRTAFDELDKVFTRQWF